MRLTLKLFIVFSSIVCFSSVQSESFESSKSIYILKHEWHVGIILERSNADEYLTALNNQFEDAAFIEIGWGDKGFYMAEKETVWLALKAALWPTASVLHVAEIKRHPELMFEESQVIELILSEADYKSLCSYINQSFKLTAEKTNVKLGKGLYGNSQFYLSKEKYHLFHTCNVWAARGLKKASVSIKPYKALTSKNVMKQLRKKYN